MDATVSCSTAAPAVANAACSCGSASAAPWPAAAAGPASQSAPSACSCSSCLLGLRVLPPTAAAGRAPAAAAVSCSSCRCCGVLMRSCRRFGHTAASSISIGSCSGRCRYETARTRRHLEGLRTAPATLAGSSGARMVRCVGASCSSPDRVLQASRRYTTALAGMPGGGCCVRHQSHTMERPLCRS
ncbi:hypothetical protein COO60DRAFT_1559626, partial [Scenedesmus sp. NREL 46B-D3]